MGLNEFNSEKPRFCGNCGNELIEGATFCAYCGSPVLDPDKQSAFDQTRTEARKYDIMTTVQPYNSQYHSNILQEKPPLPFAQHLKGVITSPRIEMPEIASRPNYRQPFLIVLIVAVISSIGMLVLFSKVTFNFTDAFLESLGIPPGTMDQNDLESMMSIIPVMVAMVTPIGFIINWLLNAVILWILHAIFASSIDPRSRSFKKMLTIIGWSFLPSFVDGIINIFYSLFFIPRQVITVNSSADIANIATPISGVVLALMILMVISFVIFAVGIILIYFAIKPIEAQGANPVLIIIVYTLISFVLTGGLTSSLL